MGHVSAHRLVALLAVVMTIACFAVVAALRGGGGGSPVGALFAIAALVSGFVLAWHVARNPIGWLLLAVPGCVGTFILAEAIGAVTFRHAPEVAIVAFAVSQFFYYTFLLGAPLILLLFPDGRLPSPRWRPTLVAYAALAGGVQAVGLAGIAIVASAPHITWTSAGNPTKGPPAFVNVVTDVLVVGCLGIVLAWVVRRIAGYRQSTGVLRQQYKWLALGAAGLIVGLGASFVTPGGSSTTAVVLNVVTGVACLPFPVTVGVAVLRWRVYDIDRVVSRTLSWAVLTALLVGVYIGMVALTTRVLPFSSPVGVAASTLVAAALFNPLRRRLQHLVDRRFNRVRYDADATVEAFAGRLREAVGIDAVRADYLETIARAVEPSSVAVWVAPTRPGRGHEVVTIS